jgi:hypothetical protein
MPPRAWLLVLIVGTCTTAIKYKTAAPLPDELIRDSSARLWKELESHRFLFVVGSMHSGPLQYLLFIY